MVHNFDASKNTKETQAIQLQPECIEVPLDDLRQLQSPYSGRRRQTVDETDQIPKENDSLSDISPLKEIPLEEIPTTVLEEDNSIKERLISTNESQQGDTVTDHAPELSELTKRLLTATYCANYMALGLAFGSVGPSLWALAHNTNTSIETIGSIFSARGLGWMIGSAVAGKLFETMNGNRLMFVSLFLQTILMAILPFLRSLWSVFTISAILAGFMSWIDVGSNSLTMSVWKDKAGPYMQFLHFAFGVGATFAPFIIGIFISVFKGHPESALWAYFPLGVLTMLTAIPLLLLKPPSQQNSNGSEVSHHHHHNGMSDDSKTSMDGEELGTAEQIVRPTPVTSVGYYTTISLISLYLFLYVGAESSYGGWVFTYAVRVYQFSEANAAYLSSAFWGSITVGRLLAVPISMKVKARTILLSDMILSIVCVVILIAFSALKSHILLWGLTLGLGLSMASIYATALSLPTDLNISMTARATSILIVGASMGDMVLPMITGWFMGFLGSNSLLLIVSGLFVPSVTIFFIVLYNKQFTSFFNKVFKRRDLGSQQFELVTTVEV